MCSRGRQHESALRHTHSHSHTSATARSTCKPWSLSPYITTNKATADSYWNTANREEREREGEEDSHDSTHWNRLHKPAAPHLMCDLSHPFAHGVCMCKILVWDALWAEGSRKQPAWLWLRVLIKSHGEANQKSRASGTVGEHRLWEQKKKREREREKWEAQKGIKEKRGREREEEGEGMGTAWGESRG